MKKTLLVILVVVFTMGTFLAFASPALACVEGKSPGYWKNTAQHPWPAPYTSGGSTASAFGVSASVLPGGGDKTLLATLQAGGGGKIAFMRQAVAQLLNMRAAGKDLPADDPTGYIAWLQGLVQTVLTDADGLNITYDGVTKSLEQWKDYLEGYNI